MAAGVSKKMSLARQEEILGFLFIAPFVMGFVVFQGMPFLAAVIVSMTDLKFASDFSGVSFIGFENFTQVFKDPVFFDSIGKTLLYSVLYVPGVIILGIFLAMLLNKKIYARDSIRTLFFLPYVSNLVAVSIVWAVVLDFQDGPVNMLLKQLGVKKVPMWLLGNTLEVIPTLVMIMCWMGVGFYMVVFLAALQGVPNELYMSAAIDGATGLKKFYYITLPVISPTTFFLTISALLNSFHNFGTVRVFTKGGPGNASWVLSINIYEEAFSYGKIAYATTQSLVLFLVILAVTVIQWKYQKRWVNY